MFSVITYCMNSAHFEKGRSMGFPLAGFRFTGALSEKALCGQPRLVLNLLSSLISLLNARILGILHHIQPDLCIFLLIRSMLGVVHLR